MMNKNHLAPDWKKLYELVLIEPDPGMLTRRISAARKAILARLDETHTNPFIEKERQQLQRALRVIDVESLGSVSRKPMQRTG
jgi:hypothetical protein